MKRIWLIVSFSVLVVALIISVLYGVGKGVALDEDKVTYDELQELIVGKEKELKKITVELEENKVYYNELQETATEHEELLEAVVNYKVEITSLETDIEEKEGELNKVNGEIAKVIDEPIKVNAGYFYFGTDIEPGRYQVKPQGNSSGNFFVRGTNRVNIILGNRSDRDLMEYTFEAFDGDELETNLPIELYLVE